MSTSKIIEIFPNQESAKKAYQYALKCGYTPKDITVIMQGNEDNEVLVQEETKKTLGHVSEGGVTGGSIGGLLGLIIALGGNVIVPGLGFIIAGPLAGLVVGTLMGTLLALGISESQVSEYQKAINAGKVILCVEALEGTHLEKKWAEIRGTIKKDKKEK